MKTHRILAAVAATSLLAACATNPANIQPAYVSPILYESLTCDQLSIEAQRVSSQVLVATGQQTSKANRDAVAMTVSMVIFWPAIFFVQGDQGNAAQLASLKGQMQAIQQANTTNNCGLIFDPNAIV